MARLWAVALVVACLAAYRGRLLESSSCDLGVRVLGTGPALVPQSVGAKASRLDALARSLPRGSVPDAVVLPFALFEDARLAAANHTSHLAWSYQWRRLCELDAQHSASVLAEMQWSIQAVPLPSDVKAAIYAFTNRSGGEGTYAVRSSGSLEDTRNTASAGLHDSFLNVTAERLEDAIKEVWASAYTHRAVSHSCCHGQSSEVAAMAVLVQQQAAVVASGVAFTREVGSLDHIVIEVDFGVGAIVSGQTDSDKYMVHRSSLELDHDRSSIREHSTLPYLNLAKLSRLLMDVEAVFGTDPQDVEFGVSATGHVVILQARDIAAWPWRTPGTEQHGQLRSWHSKWRKRSDSLVFPERPLTHLYLEAVLPGTQQGFDQLAERYGMVRTSFAVVSRFAYRRMEMTFDFFPLWEAVRDERWAMEVELWQRDYKNLTELQQSLVQRSASLRLLDNYSLLEHLRSCRDFLQTWAAVHRRCSAASALPLVELINSLQKHVPDWDEAEDLAVVKFVASVGDPLQCPSMLSPRSHWVRSVADSLRGTEEGERLLSADLSLQASAQRTLNSYMRSDARPELKAAVRGALDAVGHWALGPDIVSETLSEQPQAFLSAVRHALKQEAAGGESASAGLGQNVGFSDEADLLRRVPPHARSRVAAKLELAKRANPIREDRAHCGLFPALGLYRRALLEAGRRLEDQGQLHEASLVLDAKSLEEISHALSSADTPSSESSAGGFAKRVQHSRQQRLALEQVEAPMQLPLGSAVLDAKNSRPGPNALLLEVLKWVCWPASKLPDNWVSTACAWYATFQMLDEISWVTPSSHLPAQSLPPGSLMGRVLTGKVTAPLAGSATGRAVLRRDIDMLTHGDILVANETTVFDSIHFPMLAGLVTARGGILSHAAINAREYFLPCVVGLGSQLDDIITGDFLRVNAVDGTVELLSSS